MTSLKCNVCGTKLSAPVYEGRESSSITSLCQIVSAQTRVYNCSNCSHIQTQALDNLSDFYNEDYQLLVNSEEEDQIYRIEGQEKIYRYDHQASTLLRLVDLPEQASVLDYGCAKGTTLRKLSETRDDLNVYLYDISNKYIDYWARFIPTEQWAVYKLKPHWQQKFDLVTSFFSLEHVSDPVDMLKVIHGLLKDDGLFYCIVPDIMQNTADFVVIDHVNHFTRESIIELFQNCGFEITLMNDEVHLSALVLVARKSPGGSGSPVARNWSDIDAILKYVEETACYWSGLESKIKAFESSIVSDESLAIYGSGFYGTYIMNCIRNKDAIKCFLDRDPFKQGQLLFGRPVFDPENLPDEVSIILVGLNPAVAKENMAMLDSWDSRGLTFFYL